MTHRSALSLSRPIELAAESSPPPLTPTEKAWLAEFRAQLRIQEEVQTARLRRQRVLQGILLASVSMMLAGLAAIVSL